MRSSRLAYLLSALCLASLAVGSALPPSKVVLAPKPKPIGEVDPLPRDEAFPSRITPLRVQVLHGGGALDDADSITDRDTASQSTVSGAASLVFELEAPEKIGSLRLYGSPDLTLSVHCADETGWRPVPGLENIQMDQLGGGWSELLPPRPLPAPLSGPTSLPAGPAPRFQRSSSGVPARSRSSRPPPRGSPSWGTTRFPPPCAPSTPPPRRRRSRASRSPWPSTSRGTWPSSAAPTWCTSSTACARGWRSLGPSMAGLPRVGCVDAPSDTWSRQVERIDPEWLRPGDNHITFEPTPGNIPYAVRHVRVLAELDTAANAVERVASLGAPEMDRALHPAVDGDLDDAVDAGRRGDLGFGAGPHDRAAGAGPPPGRGSLGDARGARARGGRARPRARRLERRPPVRRLERAAARSGHQRVPAGARAVARRRRGVGCPRGAAPRQRSRTARGPAGDDPVVAHRGPVLRPRGLSSRLRLPAHAGRGGAADHASGNTVVDSTDGSFGVVVSKERGRLRRRRGQRSVER